ncbi:hypothetical protein JCM10207_008752 [Rhodosporidiobolus poonsookiae]
MPRERVLVIGAGVVGLSTAVRLLEAGYEVDIVARDLPGDEKHIRYTSPWAGAHHVSVATGDDMRLHEFDKRTFAVMSDMITKNPEGPLSFAPQLEYREEARVEGEAGDISQLGLMSRYHPNFRWLNSSELPYGIKHGAAFTAILIDTPSYLPFLVERFTSLGGRLHRCDNLSPLSDLSDATRFISSTSEPKLIVNCTGLGARTLVNDDKVFPVRGQLVIIRAPWITRGITRLGAKGSGVYDYIIPRKSGLVVLGGCAEPNNWDAKPRPELARRIKQRCLALEPDLLPPDKRGGTIDDLDVVEDAVGLRPTRQGGIRLEIDSTGEIPVVHNYGHGGYGYQSSWGSAEAAVELVKEALRTGRSKL